MQPLEQGQGSYGWMMLSVLEMNHLSSTVPDDLGVTITVDMQRMQGSFVMVRHAYRFFQVYPNYMYMYVYDFSKK